MPGLMDPSGYKPPERKKKYPVADKSKSPAIESIPVKHRYHCDADQHCDYAQYMIVIKDDKAIHLCGHHFQLHVEKFLERGYEIRKINK